MNPKKPQVDQMYFQIFPVSPRKGDQKRLEILEALIHLIAERGIYGCSFETIGERIGCGRQHVAYYFKSMDELLLAAFKYITATAQRETIKSLRETEDWRLGLKSLIDGSFKWREDFSHHAAATVFFYSLATFNADIAELLCEIRNAAQSRIEALLVGSKKKPPLLTDLSGAEASRAVHALLTANLIASLSVSKKDQNERKNLKRESYKVAVSLLSKR